MKPNRMEVLLALALERPAEKRRAFLEAMCDGDPALRQRLDALLATHEQPGTVIAPISMPRKGILLAGVTRKAQPHIQP